MRALWHAWKRFARRVADVQARLVLSLFYYVVLAPFAVVLRLRSDPLALRPGASGGWRRREEPPGPALERATRQF